MTETYVTGASQISIRFDIYGDLARSLEADGITIDQVVWRAFIEIANIGNKFDVCHHVFSLELGGRTRWLKLTSYLSSAPSEICICIRPTTDPQWVDDDSDVSSVFPEGVAPPSAEPAKH